MNGLARFARDELERLARYHHSPREYIERRTEELELVTDHQYHVKVRQQFVVPVGSNESMHPRVTLVPLGRFPKARLPDLRVCGPAGDELPVLDRRQRGDIV